MNLNSAENNPCEDKLQQYQKDHIQQTQAFMPMVGVKGSDSQSDLLLGSE